MAEERPRVYADATALIGLARIERIELLALLRTPIYVTLRVWEEAAGAPEKPGVALLQQAREKGLVLVVEEGDPEAYPGLGPGESTVLSAAAAARAAVLIDERRARAFVDEYLDLRTTINQMTGIIGLILLAKARGAIISVKPLLDDLLSESFRISPTLYQAVLRKAGEL